jgi:putative phosphoesterase
MRIGLISDTHNLMREEALAFLWGCDHIIHAGDIGSQEILDSLSVIAPVAAVRGNNDKGVWASALPDVLRLQLESTSIYVVHDMAQLDVEPLPAGINVVVCGHSHRAVVQRQSGVIYVNPGSAGPNRFNLPVTVAELVIKKNTVTPRIVSLDVAASAKRKTRSATRQNSFI